MSYLILISVPVHSLESVPGDGYDAHVCLRLAPRAQRPVTGIHEPPRDGSRRRTAVRATSRTVRVPGVQKHFKREARPNAKFSSEQSALNLSGRTADPGLLADLDIRVKICFSLRSRCSREHSFSSCSASASSRAFSMAARTFSLSNCVLVSQYSFSASSSAPLHGNAGPVMPPYVTV